MPGDACNTIGHTTNKFATKTNESAMNALMLPKAIKLETKVHAGTQTTNPTQRDAVSNVENVRLLRITGDKSSLCSEEDALEASKDSTTTSLSTPFGNEGVTTLLSLVVVVVVVVVRSCRAVLFPRIIESPRRRRRRGGRARTSRAPLRRPRRWTEEDNTASAQSRGTGGGGRDKRWSHRIFASCLFLLLLLTTTNKKVVRFFFVLKFFWCFSISCKNLYIRKQGNR